MTEMEALKCLRAAGTVVLALALILVFIMPKAPVHANVPGFTSTVVGFELASTPEHVFGILGSPGDPLRVTTVRAMDRTNRIDFLFMIAYPALFVAMTLLLVARDRAPRPLVPFAVTLAVIMTITDALENRQLLMLSSIVDATQMTEPLRVLRIFTAIKWTAIFAASGLLAVYIWRDTTGWRWSAPLFALSTLLALLALHDVSWLEPAANVLAIGWLMSWLHAIVSRADV